MITKADNFDGNLDYGNQFVEAYASAAVTAGQWVAFHANETGNPAGQEGRTIRAAIDSDLPSIDGICGVAVGTITAAGQVRIQIKGFYSQASVSSALGIAKGDSLICGAVTAGLAAIASGKSTQNYRACGRALSTPGSSLADVEIYLHPTWANS